MPCSRRRRVRLNDPQESDYQRIRNLLVTSGWRDDLPHRRVWLDIETELRRAIQRGSKEIHVALAIGELTVRGCANAEETALTIGRLRRQTLGRLAAANVREVCTEQGDVVQFAVGECEHEISFCDKSRDRRKYFLATMNQALEAAGVAQRLISLPSNRSAWAVAFVSPSTYNQAVAAGVIPAQT